MPRIIELKTGKQAPPYASLDHMINMIQLAVQMRIFHDCGGMETPGLVRYDEGDGHRYELDGKPIKGVTTYLSELRAWKPSKYYMERGTWAHGVCAEIDYKNVPVEFWKKWIDDMAACGRRDSKVWKGWFTGYLRFKEDFNLNETGIYNEIPLASRKMWVAATLDKIVMDEGPLRGILLYLTERGYRQHSLLFSQKANSNFLQLINEFKEIETWQKDFKKRRKTCTLK
jgi:hypothetical protein